MFRICALLCLVVAAQAATVTPMEKVISLLKDLSAKVALCVFDGSRVQEEKCLIDYEEQLCYRCPPDRPIPYNIVF